MYMDLFRHMYELNTYIEFLVFELKSEIGFQLIGKK